MLQVARNHLISLAPGVGIEPTTNGLTVGASVAGCVRALRKRALSAPIAPEIASRYTRVQLAGKHVGEIRRVA